MNYEFIEAALAAAGAIVFTVFGIAMTSGDSIPEQARALKSRALQEAAKKPPHRSSAAVGGMPVGVLAIDGWSPPNLLKEQWIQRHKRPA